MALSTATASESSGTASESTFRAMNRSAARATRLTRSYLCRRLPGSGVSDPEESRATAWGDGLGLEGVKTRWKRLLAPQLGACLSVGGRLSPERPPCHPNARCLARSPIPLPAAWSRKRWLLGPLRSKGPCAPRHHSILSCFTVTITNVDTDLPVARGARGCLPCRRRKASSAPSSTEKAMMAAAAAAAPVEEPGQSRPVGPVRRHHGAAPAAIGCRGSLHCP